MAGQQNITPFFSQRKSDFIFNIMCALALFAFFRIFCQAGLICAASMDHLGQAHENPACAITENDVI